MQNYDYELLKERMQERQRQARMRALRQGPGRLRAIYQDWIMRRRQA